MAHVTPVAWVAFVYDARGRLWGGGRQCNGRDGRKQKGEPQVGQGAQDRLQKAQQQSGQMEGIGVILKKLWS